MTVWWGVNACRNIFAIFTRENSHQGHEAREVQPQLSPEPDLAVVGNTVGYNLAWHALFICEHLEDERVKSAYSKSNGPSGECLIGPIIHLRSCLM